MRVADYIWEFLAARGVRHVFMVSGGGMMFLSDAIARHPGLEPVCCHHEQAAAMAAVSHARLSGIPGACAVTTGCGGTNAITGVLQAWQDNVPAVFVSGQAKRKETVRQSGLALRQFGVQEADILPIVASITKYAAFVDRPERVAWHMEKAFHLATSGRPGPVWIDVPMDMQASAMPDESALVHFRPEQAGQSANDEPASIQADEFRFLDAFLRAGARPLIIAGHGIRLAGEVERFRTFIEARRIPVAVTKLGVDLLPENHPLYVGRIGTKGNRAGNFAVQNADRILVLGARLSVSTTGHEYDLFARAAKIAVIDIDPVEHRKNTVAIDRFIEGDLRAFFDGAAAIGDPEADPDWLPRCAHWKRNHPVFQESYRETSQGVNFYYLVEAVSQALEDDAVAITDAGAISAAVHQGLRLLGTRQRFITSGGQGEMGYALPGAIGLSFARDRGEVVAITGDGAIQMNLQELQTIVHHRLPIKIFLANNAGYLSIRLTQNKFFQGRLIGSDAASGVSIPDMGKIAAAFGVPYIAIRPGDDVEAQVRAAMEQEGPVLCDCFCLTDQAVAPSVSAMEKPDGTLVSKPLEDMYPYLDRDLFRREMIIPPLDE